MGMSIGQMKPSGKHRLLAGIVALAGVTAACTASPPAASPPAGPGSRATPAAHSSGSQGIPGAQLWVRRYAGLPRSNPTPAAIAVSPDGSAVFVTGTSGGHRAPVGYVTMRYVAATGRQLWVKRYAAPGTHPDRAAGIAVSPGGRIVFVTGASTLGSSDAYTTIAYRASTGQRLWLRRYDGSGGYSIPRALVVSPDGKTVFVTGISGAEPYTPQSNDAYTTIAYDAATGTQRWIRRLTGEAHGNNQARNIAVSPDGDTVYVTGRGYSPASKYDDLTVAYKAATGTQLWTSRYNDPANGNDFANAIAVAPDGKIVYVTGSATVGYNTATGAQRWVKPFNGLGGSLAVTPNGRTVVVAGPSDAPNNNPHGYATVAYNGATGAPVWTRRTLGFPGGYPVWAQTLAISPGGGTAYVTGVNAVQCCDTDYATVAYSIATGAQQWLRTYNGPGNKADGAVALVLSPGGRTLYVTGTYSQVTYGGIATIAYRA